MNTLAVQCNQAVKRKRASEKRKPLTQLPPKEAPLRLMRDVGTDDCKRSASSDAKTRPPPASSNAKARLPPADSGAKTRLPPATNAYLTDALWRRVRLHKAMDQNAPSYLQPTKVSQARRNPLGIKSRQPRNATSGQLRTPPSSSALEDTVSSSNITKVAEASQPDSQKSKRVAIPRVTDKNFRLVTLRAYGVDILEEADYLDKEPYTHFRVPEPPEESWKKEAVVSWYQTRHKQDDSVIWLPLEHEDAELVAHEYKQMLDAQEQEAKFAFYGKLAFFRQDVAHMPASKQRKRTTYCKMEWAPKPDAEKRLFCPPIIQDKIEGLETVKRFAFENKPDLTFWLPLLMLNQSYRGEVDSLIFVVPKAKVIAPYFTVEFKKDDEDLKAAVNQLAAAAALALYNRILLRAERLLKNGHRGSWSSSHFEGIVHYGIAFAANNAHIYEVKPRDPEQSLTLEPDLEPAREKAWAGCILYRRSKIEITSAEEVIELRAWVNEIQNWGLGQYASEVVLDIKGIMWKVEKMRAKVSLLPEEIAKLQVA